MCSPVFTSVRSLETPVFPKLIMPQQGINEVVMTPSLSYNDPMLAWEGEEVFDLRVLLVMGCKQTVSEA